MDTINEIRKRLSEIELLLTKLDTSSKSADTAIKAEPPTLSLDAVYSLYPRKIGKKRGYSRLKSVDLVKLRNAVINYRNYVIQQELEPQFIKHFSTWANEWEDWIEPPIVINPAQERRRLQLQKREQRRKLEQIEPEEPALSKEEKLKRINDLTNMTTRKLVES